MIHLIFRLLFLLAISPFAMLLMRVTRNPKIGQWMADRFDEVTDGFNRHDE